MPRKTEIVPYLYYRDVRAAIGWLERAFGFVPGAVHERPRGGVHGEATLDGCMVMLGSTGMDRMNSPADTPGATQGVFVWIADVDAHFARAEKAGAKIVQPLSDQSYGRTDWARDPERHDWFFAAPTDA